MGTKPNPRKVARVGGSSSLPLKKSTPLEICLVQHGLPGGGSIIFTPRARLSRPGFCGLAGCRSAEPLSLLTFAKPVMYPHAICGIFLICSFRTNAHPLGGFPCGLAGAADLGARGDGVADADGDGLGLMTWMAASLASWPGLRAHVTRSVAGLVGAPPVLRGVRVRLRPVAVSVTVPGELTVSGDTGPAATS